MTDVKSVAGLIAGTARTQEVMNKKELHISSYKYNNGIVKADGKEKGISENYPFSPYAYKYILKLDDTPVNWDQIFNLDPMVRSTKGLYMIKYVPKNCADYKKGRPWKIGQDLIRWDIRVSGPRHWLKLCETIPELGWLNRNSTLQLGMFGLAARHPGMSFWFSVDWLRYEELLKSKGMQDDHTFVSHKVSAHELLNNPELKDKAIVIRYFNDILKEINDAERDPAVQEEMKTNADEVYNRDRNTKRDPKTGRLLKKDEEDKNL